MPRSGRSRCLSAFWGKGGSGGVMQRGARSVPSGTCLSFPARDASRRLAAQDGQRDGMEIWVLGLREGGTPGVGSAPPSPHWESYCGVGAWFLCGPPAVAVGSWSGVCRQGGLRRGAALVCITAGVVEIPEGFCASFLVSGSAVMKGGMSPLNISLLQRQGGAGMPSLGWGEMWSWGLCPALRSCLQPQPEGCRG